MRSPDSGGDSENITWKIWRDTKGFVGVAETLGFTVIMRRRPALSQTPYRGEAGYSGRPGCRRWFSGITLAEDTEQETGVVATRKIALTRKSVFLLRNEALLVQNLYRNANCAVRAGTVVLTARPNPGANIVCAGMPKCVRLNKLKISVRNSN